MPKLLIDINYDDLEKASTLTGIHYAKRETQDRISYAIAHGTPILNKAIDIDLLEEALKDYEIYDTKGNRIDIHEFLNTLPSIEEVKKTVSKEETKSVENDFLDDNIAKLLEYCRLIDDEQSGDLSNELGKIIYAIEYYTTTDDTKWGGNTTFNTYISGMYIYEKELEIYEKQGLSLEEVIALNCADYINSGTTYIKTFLTAPDELFELAQKVSDLPDLKDKYGQAEKEIKSLLYERDDR